MKKLKQLAKDVLKEWKEQDPGPKRWFKSYGDKYTEYEKSTNKDLKEATRYVDRAGKPFNIKGMSIIYVEQNQRFYVTSLYDKPVTANISKRTKIGYDMTQQLLSSIGIKDKLPMRYDPDKLDKIGKQVERKGIKFDASDIMDVS